MYVCVDAGNAGEADAGLASPLEVYQGLAADGYQVSYRRVPLSRERTPEAADLDVLHQQLMTQPVGMLLACPPPPPHPPNPPACPPVCLPSCWYAPCLSASSQGLWVLSISIASGLAEACVDMGCSRDVSLPERLTPTYHAVCCQLLHMSCSGRPLPDPGFTMSSFNLLGEHIASSVRLLLMDALTAFITSTTDVQEHCVLCTVQHV